MGGKLVLPNGEEFSSFSGAAKHVTGRQSANGWDFWEYKLPDEDDWQSVDTLRNT